MFKTAHHKVDDFRQGRIRQADEEFLQDCQICSGTEAARIGLAVRRAVGGVGLVDPLFVRADDSYPGTLERLPLWDSMDWVAFEMEVERELGEPLPSGEHVPTPSAQRMTVRDLVERVRELMRPSPTRSEFRR
ncbi:MAG: hypothetical protein HZA90_04275 [Verrucomicrobia bacterium]|nr:hypothetical protein [Verrucomicrobiota bacterium]